MPERCVLRYGDPLYNAEPVPGGEDRDASLRYAIAGWPVLDSHARYLYAKEAEIARLMEPSESYFPDEDAMRFLKCLPHSDIMQIGKYLEMLDDDDDDDHDDDDKDDDDRYAYKDD